MTKLQLLTNKDGSNLYETYKQLEIYRDVDRQVKALTKEKESLAKELKSGFFLHHDEFIYESRLLATYYSQCRVSLDQKRLEAEQPAIYKEYQTISEHRVFLLK